MELVRDIPPITLTYMAGAFLTTAACQLDLISPFSLYLNFAMIFKKFQACSYAFFTRTAAAQH